MAPSVPQGRHIAGILLGMRRLYVVCVLALLAARSVSLAAQTWDGQAPTPAAAPSQDQGSEVFKCTIMGNGRFQKKHAAFGFRVYEGSRGASLRVTYGTLPSPELARAELKDWAKKKKRVVEGGPTRDVSGRTIGKRFVAIFANAQGEEWTRVAWTKNSDLFIVDSVSARAALYFEQRFNDGGIAMTEEVPAK